MFVLLSSHTFFLQMLVSILLERSASVYFYFWNFYEHIFFATIYAMLYWENAHKYFFVHFDMWVWDMREFKI